MDFNLNITQVIFLLSSRYPSLLLNGIKTRYFYWIIPEQTGFRKMYAMPKDILYFLTKKKTPRKNFDSKTIAGRLIRSVEVRIATLLVG